MWLLVPAFNVELHLADLIDRDSRFIPLDQMLIVDDGSTDGTRAVGGRLGVRVLSHSENQGKGASLVKGFSALCDLKARWIITQDGDLQHDPAHLPAFIDAAAADRCDLVIGARQRIGSMPWDRRFSNWSTSAFLSLLAGQRLPDAQSGYRLLRSSMLAGMVFRCRRYDLETELLLKFIRRGARIGSVPISTEYHRSASSIHRGADTLRFLKIVLRYLIFRHEF